MNINQAEVAIIKSKRQRLEAEYDVRDGVIFSPGKFEQTGIYLPYFWESFLDGMADWDNGSRLGFRITPEERVVFPELKGRRTIWLRETDQGFVVEC